MLLEEMPGKTVDDVKHFSADDMLKLYGARLTPNRQKCCLLSWKVLQSAVHSPVNGDAKQIRNSRDRDMLELKSPADRSLASCCRRSCARIFRFSQQLVHGDRPLVFLDNAASTQRPRQVIDVLRRVYEHDYANVHRGIHTLSERSTEQYEAGPREGAGLHRREARPTK